VATPRQLALLGQRIRKARAAKGWNQRQLAEAAKIDKAVISRVESGSREPSLPTLHKLRDALAIDDDTWVGWLDAIKPDTASAAAS